MNMKKFMATFVAAAVTAVSFAAMAVTANAADVAIPYNGPSEGAYKVEGTDLRVNIYNIWGNSITDIDPVANVNEYVKVTFTISGLGDQVTNKNDDGTDADSYYAFLGGSIGANAARDSREEAEAAGDFVVDITADGQYTAIFGLAEASEAIECLYLQTNINCYNREGFANEDPTTTGIDITIDSIETADAEEETEPATTTEEKKDDDKQTTTAKQTTAKKDDKKTTTAKAEASAQTGDTGVVGAIAVLGAAAAAAFVVRKRK